MRVSVCMRVCVRTRACVRVSACVLIWMTPPTVYFCNDSSFVISLFTQPNMKRKKTKTERLGWLSVHCAIRKSVRCTFLARTVSAHFLRRRPGTGTFRAMRSPDPIATNIPAMFAISRSLASWRCSNIDWPTRVSTKIVVHAAATKVATQLLWESTGRVVNNKNVLNHRKS